MRRLTVAAAPLASATSPPAPPARRALRRRLGRERHRPAAKVRLPGAIWPVHPTPTRDPRHPLPPRPRRPARRPRRRLRRRQPRGHHRDRRAASPAIGAGGAICFASGFRESERRRRRRPPGAPGRRRRRHADARAELLRLHQLPRRRPALARPARRRAGRHAASPSSPSRSNIAVNLTMQRRGLPLAYVLTAGNQAQTGLADLAAAALDDPRVTALGLHIEGFGDIRAFEAMAAAARAPGQAGRRAQGRPLRPGPRRHPHPHRLARRRTRPSRPPSSPASASPRSHSLAAFSKP